MNVLSLIISVLAWAPHKGMQAETHVPGIFKLILPLLLVGVLLTVVAITVFSILNTLKKSVPLEDPHDPNFGPLSAGEMSPFEKQSRIPPALGKVLAVIFIVGLLAFMYGGLYTMGRGSGTTEQLRKEGRARAAELKRHRETLSGGGGGAVVGDDSAQDESSSEFGGSLDGMKK